MKGKNIIKVGNGLNEKLEEHSLVLQGKDHAYFSQMRKLYIEKLFADVTFVVQGEEIKAHKGIIAARSKFFENMFLSKFYEYCWIFCFFS